jgi:hypothetical protein
MFEQVDKDHVELVKEKEMPNPGCAKGLACMAWI